MSTTASAAGSFGANYVGSLKVSRDVSYHDGPSYVERDVRIGQRFFVYETDQGVMAGDEVSVTCILDQPPNRVWPYFKDFNVWHRPRNYYSAVIGDIEGQTYRLGNKPDEMGPYLYEVTRVVPERLILVTGPLPEASHNFRDGIYAFMLNECDAGTLVTCVLEVACGPSDSTQKALEYWQNAGPGVLEKWRDGFIPKLRAVVSENGVASKS